MQENFERAARYEYEKAYRQGRRELGARATGREGGMLAVLDERIEDTRIMAYVRLPDREILLDRISGTYTSSRARSFSYGFMPLHPEESEFARKWMNLCAIHLGQGLRDPIEVYEYLWDYYVVEGNKRVSVLKHFSVLSVRAQITRLVPQLDPQDPRTSVYYAFLHYDRGGLFKGIRLSESLKYEQLSTLETRLLQALGEREKPDFNKMLLRFEAAYREAGNASFCLGDAFLEYLRVYGFILDTSAAEISRRISALQPQLELVGSVSAEPRLVLEKRDEAPGLFARLFGPRKTARVIFVYEEGRTAANWIGAHERGRLLMQEELGDSVVSRGVDGLAPENMDRLLESDAADADLLLVTSSKLAVPALRYALEHPDCLTLVYSRARPDYSVGTYYGRYYEAVFLCGVAAGLVTRTDTVAYVTPRVSGVRHSSDINAFALGVSSVRPEARVLLVTKGVLPEDPHSCAFGIRLAAAEGADTVLSPAYPGLNLPGIPEGAFSLLLGLDGQGEPARYLATPAWDWGRFYTEIVRSYLNGSLEMLRHINRSGPGVAGLWWGLGTGVLRFEMADFVGSTPRNLLHFLSDSMKLGRFNPFHGPLRDRSGALRIHEDNDAKPYEILSMDWIADFVRVME